MSAKIAIAEKRLLEILNTHSPLAIAVSGGVDSLTLGTVAHRILSVAPLIVHATSPAVPAEASERVRKQALREKWELREISAGEFSDPLYRSNPYDRCYFCKSNLYRSIRLLTERPIASGANLDDLSDYRPGLQAAAEHQVIHPFVDAQIDKATLREIARKYELHHFSELPAQPCLSSRVETGIPIQMSDLRFIDHLESEFKKTLGELATVRVRFRPQGVFVELGELPEPTTVSHLEEKAHLFCLKAGYSFVALSAYRQGSAFVSDKAR